MSCRVRIVNRGTETSTCATRHCIEKRLQYSLRNLLLWGAIVALSLGTVVRLFVQVTDPTLALPWYVVARAVALASVSSVIATVLVRALLRRLFTALVAGVLIWYLVCLSYLALVYGIPMNWIVVW